MKRAKEEDGEEEEEKEEKQDGAEEECERTRQGTGGERERDILRRRSLTEASPVCCPFGQTHLQAILVFL